MMKIALPVLLVGVVMIAGIFAFMPIDKATTVHTTIQGTQLNNVAYELQTDIGLNVTATCSGTTDFLVYYTYTNTSAFIGSLVSDSNGVTQIRIQNSTDTNAENPITFVGLQLGNQTTVTGVFGGTNSQTIQFSGNGSSTSDSDDTGDLAVTVVCQSGSTPTIIAP